MRKLTPVVVLHAEKQLSNVVELPFPTRFAVLCLQEELLKPPQSVHSRWWNGIRELGVLHLPEEESRLLLYV